MRDTPGAYPRRPDLAAMEGYHSPQVDVSVRLNTNESPFAPPAEWTARLGDIARAVRWNRYPDREARELRAAIAARHGTSPDNVVVANGSNEVIQAILLAYGGHGRSTAVFEPTYQMYSQIARVTGTRVVQAGRREDFTIDPAEMRRVLAEESPDVTFLCNPNNPTGLVEPEDLVRDLVDAAPGVVVVDEAYAEFAGWSAVPLVTDAARLAVTRTFSKTLSLAALRVGYAVVPEWMARDMAITLLPYHLDAFSQAATLAALDYVDEMEARVALVRAERSRVSAAMSALGVTVWESGANFILFRPAGPGAAAVWSGLVERGVLVRDCSGWRGLEGCLRVTVGTPEENDAFLTALGDVLAPG